MRRKNFIPADAFPYTTAGTLVYDSGNYDGTLDKALEMVDYQSLPPAAGAGAAGGPLPRPRPLHLCGGLWPGALAGGGRDGLPGRPVGAGDGARAGDGQGRTCYTGTNPHGQGEETTFAQIVGEELGIPVEDVEVVHGDTSQIPMGWGTYGSRTTAVGGTAVLLAARKVREKAKKLAAHLLEAAPEDIVFDHGNFYVAGSPAKSQTIQDVALMANLAWNMPEGMQPGLEESHFYDPGNFTFPFGAHICTVEVDADTGEVKILRYIAVDDFGYVINPMIVEGQVHGGVAQGIGQALYEDAVYDDGGQLLTGSMMDYAVPNARQIPYIEIARTETPSPTNPMGVKGVGETGTIASTPGGGQCRRGRAQPAGRAPCRDADDAGACLARDAGSAPGWAAERRDERSQRDQR